MLVQVSATYGLRAGWGPPSKIIPPGAPLPNCINCMARLVLLYFMNLPSLQHLVFHTYEKPHSALNVLYVPFWVLVVKYENQRLIWLIFHKSPGFNNSKGNGIIGGKLVRPAIHCGVCFMPATRERLPIPVLVHIQAVILCKIYSFLFSLQ